MTTSRMGGQDASLSLTLAFLSWPGCIPFLGSVELYLLKVSRVSVAPKTFTGIRWQSVHLRDLLTQYPKFSALATLTSVNGQEHLYSVKGGSTDG